MYEFYEKIKSLLSQISLCAPCLGRQFAQLLTGTTNRKRGEALLLSLGLEIHFEILNHNSTLDQYEPYLSLPFAIFRKSYDKIASSAEVQSLSDNPLENNIAVKLETLPEEKPCQICQGLFDIANLEKLAGLINSHAQHYEFKSFLIGSKIPSDMIEREENIRTKYNLQFGESIKSDMNREVGKLVGVQPHFSDKELDFNTPDIVFIMNLIDNMIDIQNNPIFVYGKYNKLQRGIPQTVWYCNSCWGKGCEECDHSGRKHPDAVEEYIVPHLVKACQGQGGKFHGSGREDVDALMLGEGRPFVAQINEPKIRTINLKEIEEKINSNTNERVKVSLNELTTREKVRAIKNKSTSMSKHYRMGLILTKPQKIDISKLKELIGEIKQQTPTRVLHRRSDLTRIREVFEVSGKQIDEEHIEIEITCSGGLYVKELMYGDDGRTKPNLSQVLGEIPLTVEYLDVLEVKEI
ncbi:MAG: tRNA pseudouridine(54/55) synthase Pus10 [Candidatus Hodarchaeales archaeon]|jgi:tRNA pseudouridine synthase 10